MMENSRIAVFDLGGQYAHLIARVIYKLGVSSYVVNNTENPEIRNGTCGIILSGGPASVYDENSPGVAPFVFNAGIPILGICYGHHLIAHALGGEVNPGVVREYGVAFLRLRIENSLFKGMKPRQKVWMSHGDSIGKLPDGFEVLAGTPDCEFAAVGDMERRFFGVQFHPEVTHTPNGRTIFKNFIEICGCRTRRSDRSEVDGLVERISAAARGKKVFFLVSGGVDSTVAFILCTKALGKDRVQGVFVDTGLMRKNEAAEVREAFERIGIDNIEYLSESRTFLFALKGVHDPEEKRKAIGRSFIEVQNRYLRSHGIDENRWLLGQGTIYPDTIESGGTRHSAVIKTHHNRVDLVADLKAVGKLLEPISDYYKDEVRLLGRELGLPEKIIQKNPFPGPGLAVRCLTSPVTEPVSDKLSLIKPFLPPGRLIDSAAKELFLKSVGVQGDSRSEGRVLVIAGKIPFSKLQETSTAITNNVSGINRVAFLLKAKGDIEDAKICAGEITQERLDLLREADSVVRGIIDNHPVRRKIWQFPVILIPLDFGRGETVVLRPVSSVNGMTAEFTRLPRGLAYGIAEELLRIPGIGAVLYDITNKPPATIEWE